MISYTDFVRHTLADGQVSASAARRTTIADTSAGKAPRGWAKIEIPLPTKVVARRELLFRAMQGLDRSQFSDATLHLKTASGRGRGRARLTLFVPKSGIMDLLTARKLYVAGEHYVPPNPTMSWDRAVRFVNDPHFDIAYTIPRMRGGVRIEVALSDTPGVQVWQLWSAVNAVARYPTHLAAARLYYSSDGVRLFILVGEAIILNALL